MGEAAAVETIAVAEQEPERKQAVKRELVKVSHYIFYNAHASKPDIQA